MLVAHCLLRGDFRIFHVPRMLALRRGGTSFRPRRVALLRDYVAQMRAIPPPSG
jgi:predicted DNA-binding transcriptional regulator YafY